MNGSLQIVSCCIQQRKMVLYSSVLTSSMEKQTGNSEKLLVGHKIWPLNHYLDVVI
jgi:hypothetical protein